MNLRIVILFFAIAALAGAADAPTEMPPLPSPIAEFRSWLTNTPDARRVALARRSENSRRVIEAKIDEYAALPEPERERRLGALELRWYLRPLMETKPNTPQRAEALQKVHVLWRPMVQARIEQWDKMSPELQREVLDHELTMQYFSSPRDAQFAVLRSLNSTERQRLESRAAHWNSLSPAERASMNSRLGKFFQMDLDRQEKTLSSGHFSAEERHEMERALKAFRALSPEQRSECIASFGKFASLGQDERIAFLKNAERWQAMSPEDRDKWRRVVKALPPMPPMPPGLNPGEPQLPSQ